MMTFNSVIKKKTITIDFQRIKSNAHYSFERKTISYHNRVHR